MELAVITTYTYGKDGAAVSIIRDGKVTILPSMKIRRKSRAKSPNNPASEEKMKAAGVRSQITTYPMDPVTGRVLFGNPGDPVPTWEELMELWKAHIEKMKEPPSEEA